MTLLGGQMAMMLLVTAERSASELEGLLAQEVRPFDIAVSVRHIGRHDSDDTEADGMVAVVSVYGSDRPGIVHAVTRALASRNVNITDLDTRVIGDPDEPVHTLVLEILIPPEQHPDDLAAELTALAEDLEVDCTLNLLEADVL